MSEEVLYGLMADKRSGFDCQYLRMDVVVVGVDAGVAEDVGPSATPMFYLEVGNGFRGVRDPTCWNLPGRDRDLYCKLVSVTRG